MAPPIGVNAHKYKFVGVNNGYLSYCKYLVYTINYNQTEGSALKTMVKPGLKFYENG